MLGGIFASGNNSDYLESLRRLMSLRLTELFPGHGRNSTVPYEDIEHGMATSRRLAQETRALFDTMSHGNSFSHILRGTASYAARGLKARLAKPQPKAPDVLPSDKSGTQGVSAP